jgi:hypothetical protein
MKKKCFVAMPFKETFDKVYKFAIKEAIEQAGYECLRADELPGGGSILKNIVQNIYHAQFIIVDMTTQNPNVMYELGLSHALRKNVILLIKDETEIPFDLSSYYIIKYQDPNDVECCFNLKNEIIKSIQSFEKGNIEFGNPVVDHLKKDEQPQDPEIVKKLKNELEKKNQALIKQQSKAEAFETILNNSKGVEKVEEEKAIAQIKDRKFEFKFIGQRK